VTSEAPQKEIESLARGDFDPEMDSSQAHRRQVIVSWNHYPDPVQQLNCLL
jgi:hypothetical protein